MRALLFKLLLPILAVVGVWKPFYGLSTYIFFNIIRPEMFFWGGRTGAVVFKVAILATIAGYFRQPGGVIKPTQCREFWLLLWIFVAVIVSLLLSEVTLHRRAWSFAFEIGKLWILCWLILGIVTSKSSMLRIQNWMLFTVSFMSVWGIEQHFRGNERLEGLAGGSVADSNGIAAIGVLFLPIALNKLLTAQDIKKRIGGGVATTSILLLVIFTDSRGGFVGMVVAVMTLLMLSRKKKTFACLLVAVVFCSLPFLGDYKHRVSTISPDTYKTDYSAGSRLVLWHVGALIFSDNPMFGVGMLNYPKAKKYYGQYLTGKFDPGLIEYSLSGKKVGHSTYFGQLLPEGGLFLTIPCCLLFFSLMVEYVKSKQLRELEPKKDENLGDLLTGIIAGIVGHCAALAFINGFFMLFLPMQLVFAGQIIRLLQIEMKDNRQQNG